jgi:hypothetical protein
LSSPPQRGPGSIDYAAGSEWRACAVRAPLGLCEQGDRPGVAAPTDSAAPALTRLSNNALADRFAIVPSYRRGASTGYVKVVGAFEIKEMDKPHLVAAWSAGFLPITLSFDDGECYSLQADYVGAHFRTAACSR